MFGIGTTELVLILILAFMIFGVGKLPQVAKMLGSGVNNFRKGLAGEDDDEDDTSDKEPDLIEEDESVERSSTRDEAPSRAERSESW